MRKAPLVSLFLRAHREIYAAVLAHAGLYIPT